MLTNTPTSERIHISVFGKVNAGKSSVFNRLTNQNLSIVSEIEGTTTDAVKKTMELLPLGPVIVFDTAGIDDNTELGNQRYQKTIDILNKTDIAIFVTDSIELSDSEKEFIKLLDTKNIPYLKILNKQDNLTDTNNDGYIFVSAKNNLNFELVKKKITELYKPKEKFIISDKIKSQDTVILVIPIDESAPKGRIILPQQLVLRELLDKKCNVICLQTETLKECLNNLKNPPALVITDSQAFNQVKDIVPENIKLTSFSILMANYKGNLKTLLNGANKIDKLKDNDTVLISEGCTHHRQCNDIGTVKIPNLLKKHTNKKLNFEFTQGGEFPRDLSKYTLVVHCGGCMLNEKEMVQRIKNSIESNISITNYGILLSYLNGILKRATEILSIDLN